MFILCKPYKGQLCLLFPVLGVSTQQISTQGTSKSWKVISLLKGSDRKPKWKLQ